MKWLRRSDSLSFVGYKKARIFIGTGFFYALTWGDVSKKQIAASAPLNDGTSMQRF